LSRVSIDFKSEIASLKDEMIKMRRDFHRRPEPGFQEVETSKVVARRLEEYGLEVKSGIAKTGVVGLLRGKREGKTLIIRADMDALTVKEQTGVEYASENEGVMHACGHDGHMTIGLTTARILSRHRDEIGGNVKFIFQPAEEGPGGAKPMIEEGVMDDPKVDAAIGLHLWNYLPVGKVAVSPGPVMASMDSMRIRIKGKGGHGAIPHEAVDSIVVSSHVVTALQTVVSREIAPLAPSVVTIGTIKGGYAFNIIADVVEMEGTTRALDVELQKTLPERIERIIKGVTSGMRADYEFDYTFLYPVTVNDGGMAGLIEEVSGSVVGKGNVGSFEGTMGGEDMAFFLREVPGCYFFVGSSNKDKGLDSPHHSPKFNFDEDAMPIGVEIFTRAAMKYLGPPGH
jgi:amidohydrolase